ncbi:exodeoxyribonuclease-3 [Corynebacterium coyleae]|uniref:Endonuclease/exonuclease/phosphatase family protein n=1 Tax=Corynebacterium coyleae TaxID=53374 RepID=A0ABX8KV28_9CORY|nr:exodeoxyribonuclease III [Corynebacterium coyleae]QXB17726.1 endonuclease/exonuclease/phosphatase family protein [Corynebacterium coyleae]WJY79130.1 Exodeoxyribonuclease [Corynebacterium coyleae]SEB68279.1 exodeoxyribonuclease-3 [Corynebacterium coyleae]
MSLTIASVNVNGIRAATKVRNENNPGMLAWLDENPADVVLMQEVRATEDQARAALAPALENGWHLEVAPAETPGAKGRAGVGILSRTPLRDVEIGIPDFEDAGRFIAASLDDDTRVAALYLPSGAAETAKQDEKYRFLDQFEPLLEQWADEYPDMVIGGDWNICHRREDLKNWKANRKKSGFLPHERAFMDAVFGSFPDEEAQDLEDKAAAEWAGAVEYRSGGRRQANGAPKWFDVARRLHPEDAPYTWWTFRGQAFNNDAGWRIDVQAATANMLERAQRTWVEKAPTVEERWSDHSPLVVKYR